LDVCPQKVGIAISKQKLDRHSNMTPDAETNNGGLFAVDMSVLEPERSYGALFALDTGSASLPIGRPRAGRA
jgi:hypothetical protein